MGNGKILSFSFPIFPSHFTFSSTNYFPPQQYQIFPSHFLLWKSNSGTAGKLQFTQEKLRQISNIYRSFGIFNHFFHLFGRFGGNFTNFSFPFSSPTKSGGEIFLPISFPFLMSLINLTISFFFPSHNNNTNYFLPNSIPKSQNPFPLIPVSHL